MSRRLLPLMLAIVPVLAACRPPAYAQPEEDEPHAILKIRHVVHAKRGRSYASTVRIGEFSVDERTLDPAQDGGATVHLRVRPEPATFAIGGRSFHTEMRSVQKLRTVQESYTCYQQQCSYGSHGTTCQQVSQTCYRSKQESYSTVEPVAVNDDACSQSLRLAPGVGGVYLLQFDYLGENECKLECFTQAPRADGQFDLQPCAEGPIAAR